jgi:uncharacterized caspase-like protein/drug/metabolite transporter (DMT)-like permease
MSGDCAIVIGINEYELMQPLQYAKRDAELMREFLSNDLGIKQVYFFADEAERIVTPSGLPQSALPNFSNLITFFNRRFNQPFLGSGNNLWFFFSGHGHRYQNRDYLMPAGSSIDTIDRTGLAMDYVTERLRRSGAGNVIMFVDACRSEGIRSGEGIGLEEAEGVISFYSCSPTKYSYEVEELQQGIFTHALLNGLRIQGASNCATVERLDNYLANQVPQISARYGKSRQEPYLKIEPASKIHMILLPRLASLDDIRVLREDAFRAESRGEYELAEQLWLRVNAASMGTDNEAIEAFQRLAIRKGQSTVRDPLLPNNEEDNIQAMLANYVLQRLATKQHDVRRSQAVFGLLLVCLASLSLSLQNVLVRVIFVPSQVVGLSEKVGGLVSRGIGSSFILLFMRMVFAMPLMWLVATRLFKVNVANDLNGLINNTPRSLSVRVLFSAILQFVSFALMFTAFSFGMKPAVVVTIFFLFPVFTSLMSWFLFDDRISLERGLVILLIVSGVLLTQDFFSVVSAGANVNWISFGCAVTAAITFAGYIITSAACFKQINPVSFTAINFIIVLLLAGLCIGASLPFQPSLIGGFVMPKLWGMCFLIALTTMGGYLSTNFGTKLLGAPWASMVSSSGPVFTAILAWLLISDQLSSAQMSGIFFVTLGVLMLSLQNITRMNQKY